MATESSLPSVLIVDDSASDRRLVAGLLVKAGGLTVAAALDGRDALRRFESQIPDLVVTDLVMPEMDGMELVAAIKEEFPLVPVVLMTARGNEAIALAALRGGAAGYVPKRLLAQDLAVTVKRILAAAREDRSLSRLMHRMVHNESAFELHNDLSLIPLLLGYLQQAIRCVQLEDELDRLRIRLAVEEALLNALYHGNLEIASTVAAAEPGAQIATGVRSELVQTRLSQAPYCDRRLHVSWTIGRDEVTIVIRDEGSGFVRPSADVSPDAVDFDTVFGRGVLIMQTFMDEVLYNASGNEVTLIKRSAPPAPIEPAETAD